MALTATAQSALREPGWDEVIVPTLRKRLQTESNMIAKRLSAASLASIDDHDVYPSSNFVSRQEPQMQNYSNHKPSAIPRPSLQQTRTSETNGSAHFQPTRTRTLSALDSPNPSSTSSRPTSPMVNGKATRIPVSRVRAGSTSSYAQGSIHGSIGRTDEASHLGHSRSNGDTDASELSPVDEAHHGYSSRSTVRIPHRKTSELFKETAPFGANSITSSHTDFEQGMSGPYRVSSESEERPYEHWYRGDVARNGGVGELRIGRREEMLDIANYGHTFQVASSRIAISSYSRSRSNSRSRDRSSWLRTRQRAESVGATTRESIYLDDDDPGEDAHMVLNEQPLTDLDGESDEEPEIDSYERGVLPHPNGTISSPSLTLNGYQISQGDAAKQRAGSSVSRIPTAAFQRQASAPPRTPTPTKVARGASETSSTPSTPRSPQRLPRSQSQPQSQGQRTSPNAKRKAKSPAGTGSTSTAKKAKTKPPSSMKTIASRSDQNRRSVGQYPAADGDNMMDAIPSWTQPVPTSGNWDDVVLPVVARKKGLEGHYATADGNSRTLQSQTKSAVYEPAPGTFGYDHSKYRRKDANGGAEVIPMDEFGQKMDAVGEEPQPVTEQPKPLLPPTVVERTHSHTSPPSPPPFAHYAPPDTGHQKVESPAIQPIVPTRNEGADRPDDDGGAGCCRCVIM
ncbi:uncharacterized protein FIBRA_07968 [Fibroporia radiculosa]|uniref:Uncharacterized protein n=1 Tax=Fibroporia radiculosa TaxID=599839 RepID=J4IC38_9APHY|nr:uncharacterized protein FIBRA_07968 [Fibroporia radiculosa]CCM05736.1 predicted protein [Fibroporia radiculosa]